MVKRIIERAMKENLAKEQVHAALKEALRDELEQQLYLAKKRFDGLLELSSRLE